ncbi:hypothetical protein ACFXJ8_21805 [Nonomuraea sp. NPDC059194]|uniref:hypothetical protein n=1 Tax=Nonomuraea sp. NPDC059194 TaxID=3346764 RepID=UPI00368FDE23
MKFTQDQLGWKPWIEPLAEDELTEEHQEALVERARASVHARFAAHYSRREHDVRRLLDEGVAGEQDDRWRAIVDAAVALTATPPRADVAALREHGFDDLAISDALHAAAFFNWANRLMLSLGEPDES